MKKFMDKDFMLNTKTASKLYHEFAADMPIFDYHCHLSPKEMYEDKVFDNPKLMRTPIVRNGKQVTVGFCPEVWASWE